MLTPARSLTSQLQFLSRPSHLCAAAATDAAPPSRQHAMPSLKDGEESSKDDLVEFDSEVSIRCVWSRRLGLGFLLGFLDLGDLDRIQCV